MRFPIDTYRGVLDLSDERHTPVGDDWWYETDASVRRATEENKREYVDEIAGLLSHITDAAEKGIFGQEALDYAEGQFFGSLPTYDQTGYPTERWLKRLPSRWLVAQLLDGFEQEAAEAFDEHINSGGSVIDLSLGVGSACATGSAEAMK